MNKTYNYIVALLTLLLLSSCGTNKELSGDKGNNKAYLDTRFKPPFKQEGDQIILHINSSTSWNIEIEPSAQSWISTDNNLSGKGNKMVTLFLSPNPQKEERSGLVTVKFGDNSSVKITVTQLGSNKPSVPAHIAKMLEIPKVSNEEAHHFIAHMVEHNGKDMVNYSVEYDTSKNHSRWVAFRFDAITCQKVVKRTNEWACDPNLPYNNCYDGTFPQFKNRRMDRGHLVASEDRVYSKIANMQTFYYSNISPQLNDFNTKIWVNLEKRVQSWGRDRNLCDTLYVVKGGTIEKPMGIISPRSKPNMEVPIPSHYFMALLQVKDGKYQATAFLLPHENLPEENLKPYQMTVRELEKKTGFDFFHNLPDNIEEEVENKTNIRSWPGI